MCQIDILKNGAIMARTMIIKSAENKSSLAPVLATTDILDGAGYGRSSYEDKLNSTLRSAIRAYEFRGLEVQSPPPIEPAEPVVTSGSASVKFMITMKDEYELRRLGYDQAHINTLTPQEAADIIASGRAPLAISARFPTPASE